jgi:hypothetical protein
MQLSNMPREKNILQILPKFIYFLNKRNCNMKMTSYARQDLT